MSNFEEQVLRCIKFKVSTEQAIEKLCKTLSSKKTPEDIFEKTKLLRCDKMYLPEYIFIVDFNYICEAGIYLLDNEGKKIGDTNYQIITGRSTYSLCKRATNNNLSHIPDNFFPDYDYCLQNNSGEIELGPIEVLMCSNDSLSWEDVFNSSEVKRFVSNEMKEGIFRSVQEKLSDNNGKIQYGFYFTSKYKSDMGKDFDYEITEFSIASMLIPIYKISFEYEGETYVLYVNGCNIKSGWLSNNEVYSASLPSDTTKVKGVFSKISANKSKKAHKEETMKAAQEKWIKQIKKEV